MAGYNRISPNPFVDGAIIEASDFDTEFGALNTAFGTSGHTHDGTDGNGPKIDTAGLALNAVDSTILDETDSSYAVAGMTIDSLTITSGTAVTSIDTDLSSVSASDDTLASAKAIKTYVDNQLTASDLDFQGDSGGALSIDLDSETLTIAGGTGLTTTGSGNTLTVDIDSTVATLTGTQTLTNKTLSSPAITGNLTTDGNIDGRDIATDGAKLDGIETGADVTDTVNVTAAGALMDSEVTNLAQVKAFDSSDYATAAQGTKADNALPKAGGTMTGNITFNSTQTFDGRDVSADGAKLDGIEASADVTDSTNVQAAGALMDSEVTNLAQVKAFDSSDYATAAQGTLADSAVQPNDNISTLTNNSGFITGNQTITLSGDATGTGTTAITVTLESNTVGVDELNLTDGTAGQFLKTDGAGTISFADAPTQQTTFSTIDINGGTVDGVTIGTNSAVTDLRVDNLKLDGNTLSSTNSNGNIVLDPNGTGNITLEAVTKVTGLEPSTRYDTSGDGSVTIADYNQYYAYDIGAIAKTSIEDGMALDAPWDGDSSATNNNCRFGLSILQGNLDDTASAVVSGTPKGHGDAIAFGNIQHNSDGTAKLINGLAINGDQMDIGSTETGASTHVNGALSKNSGSFRIDHPVSSKTSTHYLVHSFVEAPQADNIYRGKVDLVNGSASVNIDTVSGMTDGTFVALNRDVQCFTSNESDWDAVKGSVSGNILTISCENTSSTATISWLVVGERKDQHMYDTKWTDENGKVIVEPAKDS